MAADWYCKIAGAELGPLSSQQLKALAADGRLRADDEVSQGQDGKWVQASRVKGLLKASGGEVLVAQPLEQDDGPGAEKPAAGRVQRAASGPLLKAKPAPKPPKVPQAAVPVAKVAAAAPAAQPAVPSPFHFKEPDAERGKSSSGKTGAMSPADAAKRRQKQRKRLLIGSLGAIGVVAVAGGVLIFANPFSGAGPSDEAPTASRSTPAEEPVVDGKLDGQPDLDIDELLDGPSRIGRTSAEPDAPDGWLDASKDTATAGPVRVRVVSVQVDKPRILRNTGRSATPPEDFLIVTIELINTDPAKKMVHAGWGGRTGAIPGVSLVDNHGNPYKARTFPGGTIEGQQSNVSLYADEPLSDRLVFERPVPAATYLRLTLPAAAFRQDGALRFQIPKAMIGAEPAAQVAEAPREPQARDDRPDAPETDGQVYDLEASEKAIEQAIGMEPERPLDGFEKLKRDNPDLFPDP